MEIKQDYQFLNAAMPEEMGESGLVNEDMSNIAAVGQKLADLKMVNQFFTNYLDVIGRVKISDRSYTAKLKSLLREGWEMRGSILQKLHFSLPEASKNEAWDLHDGDVIEMAQYYKPTATATYFNQTETFEIDYSVNEKLILESFRTPEDMSAFIYGVSNAVQNALEKNIEILERRAVNNLIGETLAAEYVGNTGYSAKSGVRAINLLYEYNDLTGQSLAKDKCLLDPDFIRYATYRIGLTADRMEEFSKVFNIDGVERHTPKEQLNAIMLSEFRRAAEVYLYNANGQLKDDFLRLLDSETLAFWQGSGTSFDFADTSALDITTTTGATVTVDGILGVIFDREAIMVCNEDRRTDSFQVPKAEFTNYFTKYHAQLYNALDENAVVFFVQ